MANSTDPDQKPIDLDLHCLQRQVISGFSGFLIVLGFNDMSTFLGHCRRDEREGKEERFD